MNQRFCFPNFFRVRVTVGTSVTVGMLAIMSKSGIEEFQDFLQDEFDKL